MSDNKIWYVVFPTYQYNEDVVALAKEAGLRILNARFDDGDGESDVPKLTAKDNSAPKPAPEPEVEPESEIELKPEVDGVLYDVFKITDGERAKRASKANITKAEADAYVAERSENQYEITEAD